MVTHIVACLWYLIPFWDDDSPSELSWIMRHGIENSFIESYSSAAYWSFSTLTTVGYGDITGFTTTEKIFSMVVMAIGVTWYAFIVSSMSSIIAGFDTYNARMREKSQKLNSFMRYGLTRGHGLDLTVVLGMLS